METYCGINYKVKREYVARFVKKANLIHLFLYFKWVDWEYIFILKEDSK